MRQRVGALLLGLALGWLAWSTSTRPGVPGVPVLAEWEQSRPDTFGQGRDFLERHERATAAARRDDLVALLLALATGCVAVAALPSWTRRVGITAAVLVGGAVGLGIASAGRSVDELRRAAGRGAWTLDDDNLRAVAGPFAETLRPWRDAIGPDDAVLLAGSQDFLLNIVAWELSPRPLYPIVLPLPPEIDGDVVREGAAALTLGRDAPARWLVDLDALAAGEAASRPVLVRLPHP